MSQELLNQIFYAGVMGLIGAVVFAAIGLISGTDETTTLAPLTLLVVLLGVPPAGVFTFFLAGAVAKHMTHAVPTASGLPLRGFGASRSGRTSPSMSRPSNRSPRCLPSIRPPSVSANPGMTVAGGRRRQRRVRSGHFLS